MKNVTFILFAALFLCVSITAQTAPAAGTDTAATAAKTDKPKRGPVFRATKDQIKLVQGMLKEKGSYSGEMTGRMDDAFRTAIKAFQKDNGLRQTGTLNRATLEKFGVELTATQKAIPASPNSYASATDSDKTAEPGKKRRGPVFRATKDQIAEAQKLLKAGSLYAGEETGKLDDPTREGLKKYQEANGIKVTGTLNQVTLEKMGIALTDRQKEIAAAKEK